MKIKKGVVIFFFIFFVVCSFYIGMKIYRHAGKRKVNDINVAWVVHLFSKKMVR